MRAGHSKSTALFIALGTVVAVLAFALNVGWIVLHWRTGVLLFFGVLFFGLIITGVVLNTIFLVREIRRNERHNAFINAVTHELKTPVASIRLYLETMQTRQVEEAKRREFQDIMIQDCDRLLHTIDQVLRAGQAASSVKLFAGSRIDVAEIVEECLSIARARHHLPFDTLRFVRGIPANVTATVMGDIHELKTAIGNLIDNAIKYSGPKIEVLVELVKEEDNVLVRVKDQGVGIPRQELKRIFKRFYRIPETVASRVKGMGLGLFIVDSVAKRHAGKVYAESAGSGQGSTFTLKLPAAPESS